MARSSRGWLRGHAACGARASGTAVDSRTISVVAQFDTKSVRLPSLHLVGQQPMGNLTHLCEWLPNRGELR